MSKKKKLTKEEDARWLELSDELHSTIITLVQEGFNTVEEVREMCENALKQA